MEPWFLPAVSAGAVAIAVVIGFIIYLCRRAARANGKTETIARKWSASIDETKDHLLVKEQMLDRFILFSLNFTSILWSSEHSLIHTDRGLVFFRRGLNIFAVLIGLFSLGIADVIYSNWYCYPSTTSIDDYNKGLCSNFSAPINQKKDVVEMAESYRGMSTWIWVCNALFIGAVSLSLAIHAYLSYNFVDRVRYGIEGSYTGTIDAINDYEETVGKDAANKMKKYVWMAHHRHTNGNDEVAASKGNFTTHDINLHRLGILFFDPFSILFGFPHIVLSRSDLAITNFVNIIVMIGTWNLYFQWGLPRWKRTCCYYDSSTSSGSAGHCDDPHSSIYHDPFRLSCTGMNLELTIIMCFGLAQLIITVVLWLYSTALYHYIVYESLKNTLKKLNNVAEISEPAIINHHKKFPMPPYGL